MGSPHPDFLAAPLRRRWTGRLDRLRGILESEAGRDRRRRAWKILRNGALVELRILDDASVAVRISRSKAPDTARKVKAWNAELATFVRDLRLAGWPRVDETAGHDGRGIAAIYMEPRREGPPTVLNLFGQDGPPSAIAQGR